MDVAYNVNDGKVFRVLYDGVEYPSANLSAWATVDVPKVGNRLLLQALRDRPHRFSYDAVNGKFVEDLEPAGTLDWPINKKYDESTGEFQGALPALDWALTAIDNISNLAEAKPVLKKMVRAIYALARRVDADS